MDGNCVAKGCTFFRPAASSLLKELRPERSAMRTKTIGFAIAALAAAVASGQGPTSTQTQNKAAYEGKAPDGGADAVRVFYLTHDETPTDTQEIVNLIRATADIQRIIPYAARRAIALRGTPAQIALAEWLIGELDKAGTPQANTTDAYEHPAPSGGGDSVRLFFFTHNETEEDLQEIVNLIRTTADIQRIYPYAARRAIALRGSAAQIALAEWLFHQFGRPASEQIRPK